MINLRRTLVTGGAGFIGSELVRQFAESGVETIAFDNFVNGKKENLAGIRNVEIREADIRDDRAVADAMKGVHAVFHLACLGVRHSIHSPEENHEVNASATLILLRRAMEAGVKRFVHVSTSEIYGTAIEVPMKETHPPFPCTVYGASKLAGECYSRAFFKTHGYETVVIRPFNSYGPRCHHEGDSGEVIPRFMINAMAGQAMVIFGDGTQTRDFTYVADTARGIREVGLHLDSVGSTVNIGFGREITVNELARRVAEAIGKPGAPVEHVEPRPGDVLRLYAETTIANSRFGFRPTVSLAEGLMKLLEWYRSSGRSLEEMLGEMIKLNWTNEKKS